MMPTLLRVGTTPQKFEGRGAFLDGDAPMAVAASLTIDEDAGALIIKTDGPQMVWPLADIRRLRDQAGSDFLILRLNQDPTARLMIADVETQRILLARGKNLSRAPKVERKWRLLRWAGAAVGSVTLIAFVLIPFLADNLAAFLPPEGEKALGDTTFEQIRMALDETGFDPLPVCDWDEDANRALAIMSERLTENSGLETELTVRILDHPMVNAFALPGGYIVFFDGLIQEAESAEEVAAVFAHEMGHVAARDPSRIALRSAGSIGVLGLLFGDFAGGAIVLFLAERLIQADYTQAAEAAADTYAYDLLTRSDLPPSGIATFFERLSGGEAEDDSILQHFMSHPEMGDRIAAARAATPADQVVVPILSEDEWLALKNACGNAD